MSERAVGAVLAGGASRRMGKPKAMLHLGGRALIEHPLAAVAAAGLEPVVIAKPDSPLPALDALVLDEPKEPLHPLLGIAVALRYAAGRPVVVVGCDMPLVPASLLRMLAEADDPVAAVEVEGELEPLLARYAHSVEPAVKAALAERRPLRDLLAELHPRVIAGAELAVHGDPNRIALNVNEPADLDLVRSLVER